MRDSVHVSATAPPEFAAPSRGDALAPGSKPPATNPGVFFRQRAWILVVIACTVVSVMIGLLLWPKSEDAGEDEKDPVALNRVDPRLDYRGPFLNVTARVKYVGSAACAECHPKQAGTY